jgi:hypothetical protein
LDVNESALTRWRQGGDISLDSAARLSTLLDVSLDWLVLGRGRHDMHHSPSPSPSGSDLETLIASLPSAAQDAFMMFLKALR